MDLLIEPSGVCRFIYSETIDLSELGCVRVERGSHVEPDEEGNWTADLSPVDGPVLGPFPNRSEALAAEVAWLHRNWLLPFVG